MKKNVTGQFVCFEMLSTTNGSAVTTGTPVVYIVGNNGTQSTGAGTSAHKGNGVWAYAPTQAETNYDHIAFTMVLANAFTQTVNVYTTFPQTGDTYPAVTTINTINTNVNTTNSNLTTTRAGYLDKLNVTGTLAHSDAASTYKADISTLATAAAMTTAFSNLQSYGDINWIDKSALVSTTIATVTSQTSITITAGSSINSSYLNQLAIVYDVSAANNPSIRRITAYTGSTKTCTLSAAPDFTMVVGDLITILPIIYVAAPSVPTAATIADAVWDEPFADHVTATSFGSKNQRVVPSETLSDYLNDQSAIVTHLTDIKGTTFVGSTDSLEAIRDRGDVAWLTGAGGSAPTIEQIRTEMDNNSTKLSSILTGITTANTNISTINTNVNAVSTNVNTTNSRLTSTRAGYLDKLNVTGTLAHSNAADTYKADITALATTATVNTIADQVINKVLPDISNGELVKGQPLTLKQAIRSLFNRFFREVTQTIDTQTVKNDSNATIAIMPVSDNGTIQTKGSA